MNKWLLNFQNCQLEQEYQEGPKHQIRKLVFIATMISLAFILGFDLINQIITSNYFHLIFDIIFIGLAFMFIIFAWKKQWLIKYALIIINLVIASVQFQMDPHIEQQYNYIFAQSIMASHMIIIATADFRQGLIQILGLVLIRLTIIYLKTTRVDIQMYGFVVIIMFFQIYVQYITDLAQRKQFLLNLKENHWEKFLTNLVRKPFYLFQFKDNYFQLIQQNKNQQFIKLEQGICDGCNLRQLLRACRFQSSNLENEILNLIQKNEHQSRESFVNTSKTYAFNINHLGTLNINFQQFQTDSIENLIILDEFTASTQNKQKQKIDLKHYVVKQIELFTKILKDPQLAYDNLMILNLNLLTLLAKNEEQISEFNLTAMFNQLKKLLKIKNMIISASKIYNVIGHKKQLFFLFTQIFIISKQISQEEQILIYLNDLDICLYLQNNFKIFIQKIQKNKIILSSMHLIHRFKLSDHLHLTLNQTAFYIL